MGVVCPVHNRKTLRNLDMNIKERSQHIARRMLCMLGASLMLAPCVLAQPHVQEVQVSRLSRIDVNIKAGSSYSFRTLDLSPGGDTELRLVRSQSSQVQHNDNDSSGGPASYMIYFSPFVGGPHQLYVLAHEGTPAGTCRVIITEDGITIFNQVVPFGGTTVTVPASSQVQTHNYHAVAPPAGHTDPILLGLGQWGSLMAVDEHTGVGDEAAILGVSGIHRLIVGSLVPVQGTGRARILANDVWADQDGDNVGPGLESAFGACDDHSDPGCHLVHNLQDSDRDSLPDYAEIFGLAYNPPLYFPRWGADPAHKDVFIEVDYKNQYPTQPFTEAHALELQDIFNQGPAGDLLNLDGQSGIRLHFDTGVQPVDPANAALLGDWAGANQIPAGSPLGANISNTRDKLFFHAVIDTGGQSFGRTFGVGLNGGTPRAQVTVFAHELGHSLGLTHEGHPSWGYNCSPVYDSTMNYAATAYGNGVQFSQETFFPGVRLNPTFLCEADGLGGGDVSHLASWGIPTQGSAVDWNRDGIIQDCGTPVRAALNFWPPSGCAAHVRGEENLAKGYAPSLAKMGSWMYAFYIDLNGDMHYRRGLMHSDARESGCPNGYAVEPGETCTFWEAPIALPMDGPVADLNTYSVDGQVHVLFRFLNSPGIMRMSAASQLSNGKLTTWSGPSLLPGFKSKAAPEMSVLYVDPSRYGVDRLVTAVWPQEGSNKLVSASYDPRSGTTFSSPKPVLDTRGNTLISNGTRPTLVHWGYDSGYFSQKEATFMVFPAKGDSRVVLYVYDPQKDAWSDLTTQAFPSRPTGTIEQPIGFGWRPLVAADGLVLDPLKGEFFLTYGATNENGVGSTWFSTVIGRNNHPVTNLRFNISNAGRFGHPWYGVQNQGGGMDYYTDPDFPYVKALFVNGSGDITFLPHPDGIYDKDFQSGSDWWIMERGACLTLRGGDVSWCGGPNIFGY